jgi:glycosyltransferase involved in cell wall biosynthesis
MRECRVLQMLSALGVGGAETWMMALLDYYRHASDKLNVQIKCDFCLTSGRTGAFDDQAKSLGAELYYFPYSRRTIRTFGRQLSCLLKERKYHAVHNHSDYAAAPQWFLARKSLPPVRAVHVHNPMFFPARVFSRKHVLVEAEKQVIARLATHILGTSREVLSIYDFDRPLFRRIPRLAAHCGFDVRPFAGDPSHSKAELCRELGLTGDQKIVLFVGRLGGDSSDPMSREVNQKNPGFAIEVMRHVIEADRDYIFVLAGGGDAHRQQLEQRVSEWGMSRNYHFLGVRHDIPKLMSAANLLLFPSRAEGLGMVAVEAQAAGLHVLTSQTTPRECVVVDNLVTFLPLEDGVRLWAETLLNICANEKRSVTEANQAVRDSAFSIENSAGLLASIYCQGMD